MSKRGYLTMLEARGGELTMSDLVAIELTDDWRTTAEIADAAGVTRNYAINSLTYHERRGVAGAAHGGLGLAVADEAVVAADRDEHGVDGRHMPEVGAVRALRRQRAVQPGGVDALDLHRMARPIR